MDSVSSLLGSLNIQDLPSAKIKVDDLFLTWLSQHNGSSLIQSIVSQIQSNRADEASLCNALTIFHTSSQNLNISGQGVTADGSSNDGNVFKSAQGSMSGTPGDGAEDNGMNNGLGSNNMGMGSGMGGQMGHGMNMGMNSILQFNSQMNSSDVIPPLSPAKKSPKKRTQSEMYSQPSQIISGNSLHNSLDSLKSEKGSLGIDGTHNNVGTVSRSLLGDVSNHDTASTSSNYTNVSAAHTGGENMAPDTARRRANFDSIPVFYAPKSSGGHRVVRRAGHGCGPLRTVQQYVDDSYEAKRTEIEEFFSVYPGGVPLKKFVHATKRLMGLPSFFNAPLVRRINQLYGDSTEQEGVLPKVKLQAFEAYWRQEIEPYDRVERFFRVIKQPEVEYILKDDFVPFLQELLHFHPGLDFLESHQEFQRKYALTVIVRIFFHVNKNGTGRLTIREVYKSNLFNAFMHVDEENDINRVREYFSYEHFYVLYCRFFELDTDKDTKLSSDDLSRYSEHALSETIVERIFLSGTRVFLDGRVGFRRSGMSFPDFVYFMLAEEDKACESSIRYWFSCCDLDGDGTLSPAELNSFYQVQLQRAIKLGHEPIAFEDVLCQLIDMIDPVDDQAITLSDLLRPTKIQSSAILFDVLFNIQKFLAFETRDPFQERMKKTDGFNTDWDRFAFFEYQRLSQDDQQQDQTSSAYGVLGYEGEMEISDAYQQAQQMDRQGEYGGGYDAYGASNTWSDGSNTAGLSQESLYDTSSPGNVVEEKEERTETERTGRAGRASRGGKGNGRTGRGRNRHR